LFVGLGWFAGCWISSTWNDSKGSYYRRVPSSGMWCHVVCYKFTNYGTFEAFKANKCAKSFSCDHPCHCWTKNQCFNDLHYQGHCGEWPYIPDIYTSLSNRCLFLLVGIGIDWWTGINVRNIQSFTTSTLMMETKEISVTSVFGWLPEKSLAQKFTNVSDNFFRLE
jgi:hypothetical protein